MAADFHIALSKELPFIPWACSFATKVDIKPPILAPNRKMLLPSMFSHVSTVFITEVKLPFL